MSERSLLCLCDSPTLETGFARVAYNLLTRWQKSGLFEEIWVCGIGYTGFPTMDPELREVRIFPAAQQGFPQWQHPRNLATFLNSLQKFTDVWMMYDLSELSIMAEEFREICSKNKIRSLIYFPVDAALEPEWTRIIAPVDVAVAYTEQGRAEARRALEIPLKDEPQLNRRRMRCRDEIHVIPHGVDATIYRRIDGVEGLGPNVTVREYLREKVFQGAFRDEDFLITVVSANQKRKALHHTLMTFARIQQMKPELSPKLWMHMPSVDPDGKTDLKQVAAQLGLQVGVDVFFSDKNFTNGHAKIPEETLNLIYNASDLLLTTTYGEGWGLPITEAMAAGTAVAGPRHTSVAELLADDRGILFDTCGWDVLPADRSRLRPRPDVDDAARRIVEAASLPPEHPQSIASYAKRGMDWARSEFLNWDRIANEWLKLFFP